MKDSHHLIFVDRFSKMLMLLCLSLGRRGLILLHVFRIHGLPLNVVQVHLSVLEGILFTDWGHSKSSSGSTLSLMGIPRGRPCATSLLNTLLPGLNILCGSAFIGKGGHLSLFYLAVQKNVVPGPYCSVQGQTRRIQNSGADSLATGP